MAHLPWFVSGWLLLVGLYGMITSRNLIHLVLCLAVSQSGTYVLLIALGWKQGGLAPIFQNVPPGAPVVDPVVQALVLTDIVVGVTITALLLALTIQAAKRFGSVDPVELRQMKG